MTDTTPTVPAPTPSDILLGRVILVLGLIAIVALGGIIFLSHEAANVPDALNVALGSAVTGLAAVLAGRRP